jgi:hypothetical protein
MPPSSSWSQQILAAVLHRGGRMSLLTCIHRHTGTEGGSAGRTVVPTPLTCVHLMVTTSDHGNNWGDGWSEYPISSTTRVSCPADGSKCYVASVFAAGRAMMCEEGSENPPMRPSLPRLTRVISKAEHTQAIISPPTAAPLWVSGIGSAAYTQSSFPPSTLPPAIHASTPRARI